MLAAAERDGHGGRRFTAIIAHAGATSAAMSPLQSDYARFRHYLADAAALRCHDILM